MSKYQVGQVYQNTVGQYVKVVDVSDQTLGFRFVGHGCRASDGVEYTQLGSSGREWMTKNYFARRHARVA